MKVERYFWLFLLGCFIGFTAYLGFDSHRAKQRYDKEVARLQEALSWHETHKPDTVYRVEWRTVQIPKPYKVIRWVHDTVELHQEESCILRWYADSLHFDDMDIVYNVSTLGTLEEFGIDYKLKGPKIVTVHEPCPPPPVVVPPSRWSVQFMMGYPASGYLGAVYDVTPKLSITGGVFTSNSSTNVLGGVAIKIK